MAGVGTDFATESLTLTVVHWTTVDFNLLKSDILLKALCVTIHGLLMTVLDCQTR